MIKMEIRDNDNVKSTITVAAQSTKDTNGESAIGENLSAMIL